MNPAEKIIWNCSKLWYEDSKLTRGELEEKIKRSFYTRTRFLNFKLKNREKDEENSMTHITLKNTSTGATRIVKQGFSWTVFFFGIWALMFRGEWKIIGYMFLGVTIVSFISFMLTGQMWEVSLPSLGGLTFIYAFFANKQLKYSLLNKGWEIVWVLNLES